MIYLQIYSFFFFVETEGQLASAKWIPQNQNRALTEGIPSYIGSTLTLQPVIMYFCPYWSATFISKSLT